MKKVFAIMALATMFAMASCSSNTEVKEEIKTDSVAVEAVAVDSVNGACITNTLVTDSVAK